MSAIVYQIPSADRVLILDSRQGLFYPFISPNWLDIRLGLFLSLTTQAANDDPTGLSETLATTGSQADRAWIGFKTSADTLGPRLSSFFGLTNSGVTEGSTNSVVEAGDVSQRWRYKGIANIGFMTFDALGATSQQNTG